MAFLTATQAAKPFLTGRKAMRVSFENRFWPVEAAWSDVVLATGVWIADKKYVISIFKSVEEPAGARGRFMLILTEPTPNPDALKYVPPVQLTDGRTWTFNRLDKTAASSPLAQRLLNFGAVRQVFLAREFVTITRETTGEGWEALRAPLLLAIAEHLESGEPAVYAAQVRPSPRQDVLETSIRDVLALHVRPGVARDGGDVVFDRFDPPSGTLWVRMEGACGGCPSARRTLKAGVEEIVRARVPAVLRVEEAAGEGVTAAPGLVARLKTWSAGGGAASEVRRPRSIFRHNGQSIHQA